MLNALSGPNDHEPPLSEGPRPVENFKELKAYLDGGLEHFDWKIAGGTPLSETRETGQLIQDTGNGMLFERTPDGNYRLSINLRFFDSYSSVTGHRSDHWDAYVFELSSSGAFVRGQVTRRGGVPVQIYHDDYLRLSNRCLHPDARFHGGLAQYQASPRYAQAVPHLPETLASLLGETQEYSGRYDKSNPRSFSVTRRPEGSWKIEFLDAKNQQQIVEINPQGGCAWSSFLPTDSLDSPIYTVNGILRDKIDSDGEANHVPPSSSGWIQ